MLQTSFIVGTIFLCVVLVLLAYVSVKTMKMAMSPADYLLNEKLCEKVIEFKEDIKKEVKKDICKDITKEVKKDICKDIAVKPDSKIFTGTRWDK